MSSPTFQGILPPVDGSLSTERLVGQALEFAGRIDACVNAIQVLPRLKMLPMFPCDGRRVRQPRRRQKPRRK